MKPVPVYSDPELVDFLRKKDPAACTFLYEKYGPAIYGLIRQVLPDTEIANETFVEVFATIMRSIDEHDSSKSRLFTWLIQITRQVAIEKLKSLSSRTSLEAGAMAPGVKVVGSLMSSLDTDQQYLMNLAYLKGYSVEEMAGTLELPAEIVKERINRALIAINSQHKKK